MSKHPMCMLFILLTLMNARIASGSEFERIENHVRFDLEPTYFAVQKNLRTIKKRLVYKRKKWTEEKDPVMRTVLETQITILEAEKNRLKQAEANLYQSFGHDEYELVFEIADNNTPSPN